MTIYLSDTSNHFYNAANRLKRKISYEARMKFALKSLSTIATEQQNLLELNVSKRVLLEAFLFSNLLEHQTYQFFFFLMKNEWFS